MSAKRLLDHGSGHICGGGATLAGHTAAEAHTNRSLFARGGENINADLSTVTSHHHKFGALRLDGLTYDRSLAGEWRSPAMLFDKQRAGFFQCSNIVKKAKL